MSGREDTRLGLRWARGRPVETALLVVGIALGIGATAAGIALAGHAAAQARAALSSPRYREIVVTAQESASDMDVPALPRPTGDTIILTSADLAARGEAPDVEQAYVANRMMMRLGESPGAGGPDGGGPPPGEETTSLSEAELAAAAAGPQPALEEITGYRVSPEFFTAWGMTAVQGSLFTSGDMQTAAPRLVLGSRLAADLFEDGRPVGRQVLARGSLYTITGTLAATGTEYDGMAFAPALMAELTGRDAMARMFMRFDTSLHFTVSDPARLAQARAQVLSWFEAKYGEGSVSIQVPREAAEAAGDRSTRLVTVILFLALSALVIAAANVMNILASRAMRKRRSVGILKALGATAGNVFRLFAVEAALIGAAGAAAGTAFSILVASLMQKSMGLGGAVTALLAAGVLGAGAVVTALTILPALQAARLPAAEAIRCE
jgi:hypothetical protein